MVMYVKFNVFFIRASLIQFSCLTAIIWPQLFKVKNGYCTQNIWIRLNTLLLQPQLPWLLMYFIKQFPNETSRRDLIITTAKIVCIFALEFRYNFYGLKFDGPFRNRYICARV